MSAAAAAAHAATISPGHAAVLSQQQYLPMVSQDILDCGSQQWVPKPLKVHY